MVYLLGAGCRGSAMPDSSGVDDRPLVRHGDAGAREQGRRRALRFGAKLGFVDQCAPAIAHDDLTTDDDVAHGSPVGAPHELQRDFAPRRPRERVRVMDHHIRELAGFE